MCAGYVVFVKKSGKTSAPYNLEAGQEYTIGSSADCDIRFKFLHPLLQDTHALLYVNENGIATLTNKCSEQTIKVNDQPLVRATVLKHEDTFDILGKVFQYFNDELKKVVKAQQLLAQQFTNDMVQYRKSVNPLLRTPHKTSPLRKYNKAPSFVTPTRTKISPRYKTESKASKTITLPKNAKKRRFSLGTFKCDTRSSPPKVSTQNLQLSLAISEIEELTPSTSSGSNAKRISRANDVLITVSPNTLPSKNEKIPRKSLLRINSNINTSRHSFALEAPAEGSPLRLNNSLISNDENPEDFHAKRISSAASAKGMAKRVSRINNSRRKTINILSPKLKNRVPKILPRRSIRSLSATSTLQKHSPSIFSRNLSTVSKQLDNEKLNDINEPSRKSLRGDDPLHGSPVLSKSFKLIDESSRKSVRTIDVQEEHPTVSKDQNESLNSSRRKSNVTRTSNVVENMECIRREQTNKSLSNASFNNESISELQLTSGKILDEDSFINLSESLTARPKRKSIRRQTSEIPQKSSMNGQNIIKSPNVTIQSVKEPLEQNSHEVQEQKLITEQFNKNVSDSPTISSSSKKSIKESPESTRKSLRYSSRQIQEESINGQLDKSDSASLSLHSRSRKSTTEQVKETSKGSPYLSARKSTRRQTSEIPHEVSLNEQSITNSPNVTAKSVKKSLMQDPNEIQEQKESITEQFNKNVSDSHNISSSSKEFTKESPSRSTRKSLRYSSRQIQKEFINGQLNESASASPNFHSQSRKSITEEVKETSTESSYLPTRKSTRCQTSEIPHETSLNEESMTKSLNVTIKSVKKLLMQDSNEIQEQEPITEQFTKNVSDSHNISSGSKKSTKKSPESTRNSLIYSSRQIQDESINEQLNESASASPNLYSRFRKSTSKESPSKSTRKSLQSNTSQIREEEHKSEQLCEYPTETLEDSSSNIKKSLSSSIRKSLRYNSKQSLTQIYKQCELTEDCGQIQEQELVNAHASDPHKVSKNTSADLSFNNENMISPFKSTRKSLKHNFSLNMKDESRNGITNDFSQIQEQEFVNEDTSNSHAKETRKKSSFNTQQSTSPSRSARRIQIYNSSLIQMQESINEDNSDSGIISQSRNSVNEQTNEVLNDSYSVRKSLRHNSSSRSTKKSLTNTSVAEPIKENVGLNSQQERCIIEILEESATEEQNLSANVSDNQNGHKSQISVNKSIQKSLKLSSVEIQRQKEVVEEISLKESSFNHDAAKLSPKTGNVTNTSTRKSTRHNHTRQDDKSTLNMSTSKLIQESQNISRSVNTFNRSTRKSTKNISSFKESLIVNISSSFDESPAKSRNSKLDSTSSVKKIKRNNTVNSQEETLDLNLSQSGNTSGNLEERLPVRVSIFDESTEVMPSPVQRLSRNSIRSSPKKSRNSNNDNKSSLNSVDVIPSSSSIISVSSQSFSSFKKIESNITEREIDVISATFTPNGNRHLRSSQVTVKNENSSMITRTPRSKHAMFEDAFCTSTPFCKPNSMKSNQSMLGSTDSRTESKKLDIISVSSDSVVISADVSPKRRSSLRTKSISHGDNCISCRNSVASNKSAKVSAGSLENIISSETPILHRVSRTVNLSGTPKKSELENETPKSAIKSTRLSNNSVYNPLTEDITPVTPEKPFVTEFHEESFKTPVNTPGLFESIKESVIRSRKRRRETNGSFIKETKKAKIDIPVNMVDEQSMKKSNRRKQKSPRNDLTKIPNLRPLMSPKNQKTPKNDLRDVIGVKRILEKNSPLNDLTDVPNLKLVSRTPKNDLTNVVGVKRIFQKNSPHNDLSNVPNLKRLVSSKSNTPKNDLTDVKGVKNVFRKSSGNDLRNIPNLRNFVSPKSQKSPKNSLLDVSGVANIFNVSGVEVLHQGSDIENSEDLFSKLTGRKPVRSYRGKSLTPNKNYVPNANSRKTMGDIPICSPRVQQWVNEQTNIMHTSEEKQPQEKNKEEEGLSLEISSEPIRTKNGRSISPKRSVSQSIYRRKSQGDAAKLVPDISKWKSEPPQLIPLRQSVTGNGESSLRLKKGTGNKKVAFADNLLQNEESNEGKSEKSSKKRSNQNEDDILAKKLKLDDTSKPKKAKTVSSDLKGDENTKDKKKIVRSTSKTKELPEAVDSPVRKSSRIRKLKQLDADPVPVQETSKSSNAKIDKQKALSKKTPKTIKKPSEPEETNSLVKSQETEEVVVVEIENFIGKNLNTVAHSTPTIMTEKSEVVEIPDIEISETDKPVSRRGKINIGLDEDIKESPAPFQETKKTRRINRTINEVSELFEVDIEVPLKPKKTTKSTRKLKELPKVSESPVRKSSRTRNVLNGDITESPAPFPEIKNTKRMNKKTNEVSELSEVEVSPKPKKNVRSTKKPKELSDVVHSPVKKSGRTGNALDEDISENSPLYTQETKKTEKIHEVSELSEVDTEVSSKPNKNVRSTRKPKDLPELDDSPVRKRSRTRNASDEDTTQNPALSQINKRTNKINEVSKLSEVENSPLKRSDKRRKVEAVDEIASLVPAEFKKSGRRKVITGASGDGEIISPREVERTTRKPKEVIKDQIVSPGPVGNIKKSTRGKRAEDASEKEGGEDENSSPKKVEKNARKRQVRKPKESAPVSQNTSKIESTEDENSSPKKLAKNTRKRQVMKPKESAPISQDTSKIEGTEDNNSSPKKIEKTTRKQQVMKPKESAPLSQDTSKIEDTEDENSLPKKVIKNTRKRQVMKPKESSTISQETSKIEGTEDENSPPKKVQKNTRKRQVKKSEEGAPKSQENIKTAEFTEIELTESMSSKRGGRSAKNVKNIDVQEAHKTTAQTDEASVAVENAPPKRGGRGVKKLKETDSVTVPSQAESETMNTRRLRSRK